MPMKRPTEAVFCPGGGHGASSSCCVLRLKEQGRVVAGPEPRMGERMHLCYLCLSLPLWPKMSLNPTIPACSQFSERLPVVRDRQVAELSVLRCYIQAFFFLTFSSSSLPYTQPLLSHPLILVFCVLYLSTGHKLLVASASPWEEMEPHWPSLPMPDPSCLVSLQGQRVLQCLVTLLDSFRPISSSRPELSLIL